MADIFISYSQRDKDIVASLADVLEGYGFSVWWDYNLVGGVKFRNVILDELHKAKAVIVLWTQDSVNSEWVRDEADEANVAGKLVPVRLPTLEFREIPLGFRGVHTETIDDHENILRSLERHGLAHCRTPSEQAIDLLWKTVSRRVKASGEINRRMLLTGVAGAVVGVSATKYYDFYKSGSNLLKTHSALQGAVSSVTVTADGKHAIVAGNDSRIRVLDLVRGEFTFDIKGHKAEVTSLSYSNYFKTLYSTSEDGRLGIWNAKSEWKGHLIELNNQGVRDVQLVVGDHKRALVLLFNDGKIGEYEYTRDNIIKRKVYETRASAIRAARYSYSSNPVVAYADGKATELLFLDGNDGKNGDLSRFELHDGKINDIDVLQFENERDKHRPRLIGVTASDDGTIRLVDYASLQSVHSFSGHKGAVSALASFSGGAQADMASGGVDATVRVWNSTANRPIAVVGSHSAPVTCVSFTHDGRALLSGSADGVLKHWLLAKNAPA